jgi:hypothetical protein
VDPTKQKTNTEGVWRKRDEPARKRGEKGDDKETPGLKKGQKTEKPCPTDEKEGEKRRKRPKKG